jgi:hypothetical protein
VLLSGGGNDFAGPPFEMLLEHAGSPQPGANDIIISEVIHKRLRYAFAFMLASIDAMCQKLFGAKTPIIVHGYDYPVPDGRGFMGGLGPLPGPWLSPGFAEKELDEMAVRKRITARILDEYNSMLAELGAETGLENVRYLDLREQSRLTTPADGCFTVAYIA